MSKYTTEVRYICEQYAGFLNSTEYPDVETVISASKDAIFGDFPIFDENYRSVLEQKILRHYFTREIGFETVALWKLKLNTKMNEIMPYYNQLYKSQLIEFNPLYDVDLTRDHRRTNEGTTKGTYSSENSGEGKNHEETEAWNKFNDTPQGGITGLENDTYITTATKNTNESDSDYENSSASSGSNESEINGLEDYIEHVKGTNGGMSYSKRLMEFRQTFLNIDMDIIKDLSNLFFYLW